VITMFRDWTFAVLWIFALTIPWEAAVEELPRIGTLSRGVGLLAIPTALVGLVGGGRRHRLLDTHIIMVVLTGWTLTSVAWSIMPDVTLKSASTMLQLLGMVLLLWEFGRDGHRRRRLLWAFVLGAMVGCVAIFHAAITQEGVTTPEVRFSEGGVNANTAALTFCLAIPVAWHLSLTSVRAVHRWLAGLYVPVGAVATVFTGSRGGLLTLFLALSILPLTLRFGGLRFKVFALASLGTSIVVVTNFVPTQTLDRLETIQTELTKGDLGGREQAWEASWKIFASVPITGVGAGASELRIEPIVGRVQGPHNTYLSLAADLGAVGLGLFLLLLMSVAGRCTRLRGKERQWVGVLLITLVIGLLPGHNEYLKITWLVIAVMLAETAAARPAPLGGFATLHGMPLRPGLVAGNRSGNAHTFMKR
jgi:O-antigen ligase